MNPLRLITLAAVAALLCTTLAACGGGDWECPPPPAVAEGKKAIPAEPCADAAY